MRNIPVLDSNTYLDPEAYLAKEDRPKKAHIYKTALTHKKRGGEKVKAR